MYVALEATTRAVTDLSKGLAVATQTWNAELRKIHSRFDALERIFKTRQAELEDLKVRALEATHRAERAEDLAEDVRSSSHDMEAQANQMREIFDRMQKHDSIRAQKLIDDRFGVLTNQQELEDLRAEKAAREALQKAVDEARRNYTLTTRGLIVSGIIVTLVGVVATYFVTRATTHQEPDHSALPAK